MPIDTENLESYALHQFIFKPREDTDPMRNDLSNGGLNEVTPRGAEMIADYALKHELDGKKSRANNRKIDGNEKEIIKTILNDNHWGDFFEQDGRVAVAQRFGIDVHEIPNHIGNEPIDAGNLTLPERVSQIPAFQLQRSDPAQLPQMFGAEVQSRRDYFEDSSVTKSERGLRILGLLRDYAEALNTRGQQQRSRKAGKSLLDAFFKCKYADVHGSKDYNGFGVGAAQSLVLGLDVNKFKKRFQDAFPADDTTHLALDGGMAKAMSYMDKWRKANGQAAKAEALENASYLDYMIGKESGHKKAGSLDERRPFATSGVNFGVVLFPGDEEIASAEPKSGFEFPIDCLDGFSRPIRCVPQYGEKMIVTDKEGKELKATKIVEDVNGKKVWSAKFTDDQGQEVAPENVIGHFVDRYGNKKGDGKADKQFNMWWFGYCDRNTAQRLYKAKWKLPQLDRESIKVKVNGKTVKIPKKEAQQIIDCDISSIVTGNTGIGFRFNNEPAYIILKNGSQLRGKIRETVLEHGPAAEWIKEDIIGISDTKEHPMFGVVEVVDDDGNKRKIDVGQISSISKKIGSDTVNINMKRDSYPRRLTGTLNTQIPWEQASQRNGRMILRQSKSSGYPIRGDLSVEMRDGSTRMVPVSEVQMIAGEMQKEMRPSEFAIWVSQTMHGLFATDSSKGDVVSNGVRWVNRFELAEQTDDQQPEWVRQDLDSLKGVGGKLKRKSGDKIVWMRGSYAYRKGVEPNTTQFSGWWQVDKEGRIINESFLSGEPDFGWGATGKPNWQARSSFSDYIDPEMRLALMVNGVKDEAKLEALAAEGSLPESWKDYQVAQGA